VTATSGTVPGRVPSRFTLAIDPGPTESGFAVIEDDTRRPVGFGKIANDDLIAYTRQALAFGLMRVDRVVIEMIASYGMSVGAEVFETCVWIGRFEQVVRDAGRAPVKIKRQPVKMHHCYSGKATDANVTQALIDRFASGVPNRGKGSKALPGWFYGFAGDVWQAYALGVYAIDEGVR